MFRLVGSFVLSTLVACSSTTSITPDAGTDAGPDADPDASVDPVAPWPEWAFHHWVWENESTEDGAVALVDDYLARDTPVCRSRVGFSTISDFDYS